MPGQQGAAPPHSGKPTTPVFVQRYGRATTHTLRDTYASWLVQRGVSLFKVQLGHSDTRMTQKYAKLDPRRVADEVAQIFDNLSAERAA